VACGGAAGWGFERGRGKQQHAACLLQTATPYHHPSTTRTHAPLSNPPRQGWDKTYCLQFVNKDFDVIHFFGDKTFKGGNDYEIFTSEETIGHTVTSPDDTRAQCTELFMS